ncbi:hypothetical protein ACJX0J_030458, partial [Zea mays]
NSIFLCFWKLFFWRIFHSCDLFGQIYKGTRDYFLARINISIVGIYDYGHETCEKLLITAAIYLFDRALASASGMIFYNKDLHS